MSQAGINNVGGAGGAVTLTSVDTSVHLTHIANNYDLSAIGPTPFIVGAVLGEECNYTSIQLAMDDCFAAGGGVILVRTKTTPYVENLTFRPGVGIIGWCSLGQIPSSVAHVVVQGNHTFTAINAGSVVTIQGVSFVLSGSTTFLTINVPDTFFGLFAFKECGVEAVGAGEAGIVVNAVNTGTCVIAFVLTNLTSDQACVSAQGTGGHLIIAESNVGLTSNASNIIESTAGTAIIQLNPGVSLTAALNCISVGGTFSQILMDDVALTSTNETINFVAGANTANVANSLINCNAPSGFWVAGTGTLNWANEIFLGSATALDPLVTSNKLNWQPYAEAGTNTAPRGTSAFDSTQFTVTDGFVQLSAPSAAWQKISADQTLAVNTGYFCIAPGGALSLALPATSTVGDVIELNLAGATSFTITQGAGQQISYGSMQTTLGVGGSLSSNAQGDSIKLVCFTANLVWNAISSIGSFTIV